MIDRRQSLWDWKINRPKHVTRALHFNVYWLLAEWTRVEQEKKEHITDRVVCAQCPMSMLLLDLCLSVFDGIFPRCATLHSIFVQVYQHHYIHCAIHFGCFFFPSLFSTQFPFQLLCVSRAFTQKLARAIGERRSVHEPFIVDVIDCLYCVRPLPAAFCHFSCATAHFPHTGLHHHMLTSSSTTTESVCKQ